MNEPLREKSPGLLAQLEAADPRLQVLVYYAAALSLSRFGVVPVVTQVKRERSAQLALHGAGAALSVHEVDPCRGADLRTRGLLTDEQAQAWEDELDRTVEYDPPLPEGVSGRRFTCATFETQAKAIAAGRDPNLPPVVPHLHVQVPAWPAIAPAPPKVRLWIRVA